MIEKSERKREQLLLLYLSKNPKVTKKWLTRKRKRKRTRKIAANKDFKKEEEAALKLLIPEVEPDT